MLFSSYEFLLVFLPLVLAGLAVARHHGVTAVQLWLLTASIVFYGWWNPTYLALLAASIGVNFTLGRGLQALTPRSRPATALLAIGVAFNLGLLAWFKYAGFLVETAARLTGNDWTLATIVLPLAISFFTFQQLAFLVEAWRSRTPIGTLVEYALFVLFFPQLIAGPIVQHGDVIGQFRDPHRFRLRWDSAAVGLATFIVGLCKKVLLADALAPAANAVFDAAAAGQSVSTPDAWLGTLAYTLQLYFDFSGYSDMAIGLGGMCGVRLPTNFSAPYQADSLSDFWRRWHMTLSRFLRDYLYIPLGGSRCGPLRRSANLLVTMLLGGLWHGAGWTYVVWGAYHGVCLCLHHAWTAGVERHRWTWTTSQAWRIVSRAVTLVCVMAGWVLFRSADLPTAGCLLLSLSGRNLDVAALVAPGMAATLAVLLAAVQFLPTTQQLISDPQQTDQPSVRWLAWRPTAWHGVACSAALIVCLTLLTRVKEFLYFQF